MTDMRTENTDITATETAQDLDNYFSSSQIAFESLADSLLDEGDFPTLIQDIYVSNAAAKRTLRQVMLVGVPPDKISKTTNDDVRHPRPADSGWGSNTSLKMEVMITEQRERMARLRVHGTIHPTAELHRIFSDIQNYFGDTELTIELTGLPDLPPDISNDENSVYWKVTHALDKLKPFVVGYNPKNGITQTDSSVMPRDITPQPKLLDSPIEKFRE